MALGESSMGLGSPRVCTDSAKAYNFIEEECIPAEPIMKAQISEVGKRWTRQPLMSELRENAKKAELFNLFLPHILSSPSLINLEYSCCAELMVRVYWAQQRREPETGNIELLAKYCNQEQKKKWPRPLLDGTASSAYSMTEPDVASLDATQISCRITREANEYVINGRKLHGNRV
ncbi:acyl-CoA dehydrogenase domain-containing protein [Rhexocercosporidium sp. MPI-PUGE-AT-0058]|nr:acyl-CoA dehydrogenase domain-containing protein [Rhexocercosporidium sp. MPI-PUGE-AT-0058]